MSARKPKPAPAVDSDETPRSDTAPQEVPRPNGSRTDILQPQAPTQSRPPGRGAFRYQDPPQADVLPIPPEWWEPIPALELSEEDLIALEALVATLDLSGTGEPIQAPAEETCLGDEALELDDLDD